MMQACSASCCGVEEDILRLTVHLNCFEPCGTEERAHVICGGSGFLDSRIS